MRDGYKETEIGVIPLDWEVVRLGDICDILDNKRVPLSSEQRSKIKGDIPYYGANGVVDYINDFLFNEELVLLAEDGGNFSEYKIKPIAYMINGKSWINNHTHILRAKNNQNHFLFYNLVHKNITAFINGGTRAKLNRGELVKILIPLPPLTQQKKIAKILSTTDNKIEAITKQIKKEEMVKKGLMQKLFNETEKSWKFFQLNQVLEFQKEALKMNDEQKYELITVKRRFGGVKSRGIFLGKEVLVKNQFYLRENDFLISKRQISHGACGLVPKNLDGAIVSNEYNIFTSKKKLLDLEFFNYYVQTPNLHRSFYQHSHGVHIEKMLFNTNSWLRQKIIFPPLKQQQKIANILTTSDQKIEILKAKKEQYQELKKGLMQKLLTGEVGV